MPMRLVRRFLALSAADRTLLLQCVCALAAMRIALGVLSVGKVRALVARAGGRPPLPDARRHSAERIGWAVQAAARQVPRATCLPQALTAHLMLMRHGHPARLRIGVAVTGHHLEGHAWVEGEAGRILAGGDVARYIPLEPAGSEGARSSG